VALAASIFDHEGRLVELGEKLGAGGEGSVFAVPRRGYDLVAKLYHTPLEPEKHAKLASMVSCGTEALRGISAWPQALLHAGRKGPVRGFLMPRLFEHAAVHNVYGPAHRKAKYPKADWAFLVQVARNVAAAFDTIHGHGHVIGDVNQGNVFVGGNALVRLIDCDSFQITAGSTQFPCEVGVPHFSAPELLRAQSFRDVQRNVHHDNFGLAALVFHLLFMGRHPFAGVYSGAEEMPIERAIKEYRYAFGADAASYQMARPPGSVGPEIASAELAGLFEHAFRKDVLQRPPARRWVQALESLSREIRTCGAEGLHRYYGRLGVCPWCELEVRDQLVFFVRMLPVASAAVDGFDLSALWQQIEAVRAGMQPPSCPVVPAVTAVTAEPLPRRARISVMVQKTVGACILGIVILLIILRPLTAPAWITVGYWAWSAVSEPPSALRAERNRRKVALSVAEDKWASVQRKWSDFAAGGELEWYLGKLHRARVEYEKLGAEHEMARRKLLDTLRERQLLRFLSRFHVEDVTIADFGAVQVAALVCFGVETAAEVERSRLEKIGGLSSTLITQLLAWRWGLERMFKFDAARDGRAADHKALDHWYAERHRSLAATLTEGLEELRRKAVLYDHRRRAFLVGARIAAATLAQARANMEVF
jgi:DNA-binding helix-hairpin-helix protein with protein kinase domain